MGEGKKSKTDTMNVSSNKDRNRYSMGATIAAMTQKTSPKRERRHRSPSSSSSSKVNSAPPTMKDSNFFGNNPSPTRLSTKQLSPTSQSSNQRKYSSSSSSGGSERFKDTILFPFDREALDYERIQRECFAVKESSSSSGNTSDSDGAEPCSVYERTKLNSSSTSPKATAEFYQQYTLLSQKEQQQLQQQQQQPSSRKNSKRLRSNSLAQKYIPKSDAFSPKSKTNSPTNLHHHSPNSQVELNKFEDIANKFDQMPPKHGSIVNLATKSTSPLSTCNNNQILNSKTTSNNNVESISSNASSPSNSRSTTPPLPNLRVDFFMEKSQQSRKKSFKNKPLTVAAIEEVENTRSSSSSKIAAHDFLADCQYNSNALASVNVAGNSGGGPINVTANPMEVAVCTQPRATIVVQQVSIKQPIIRENLRVYNYKKKNRSKLVPFNFWKTKGFIMKL